MDEQAELQRTLIHLHQTAVEDLAQGYDRASILRKFSGMGIDPALSLAIIGNVENDAPLIIQGRLRVRARLDDYLRRGVGFVGLGALASWISYSVTAPGGTYIIWTGAIIVGLSYVTGSLQGMLRLSRNPATLPPATNAPAEDETP